MVDGGEAARTYGIQRGGRGRHGRGERSERGAGRELTVKQSDGAGRRTLDRRRYGQTTQHTAEVALTEMPLCSMTVRSF